MTLKKFLAIYLSIINIATIISANAVGYPCDSCGFEDLRINISGDVMAAACRIAADSTDQTVNLSQANIADLNRSQDKTINKTEFFINLEDCSYNVQRQATVTFKGNPDSDEPYLLKLDENSGRNASGIGILITDINNKIIPINGTSDRILLRGDSMSLKFFASYKATRQVIKPGIANGHIEFIMEYY